MNTTLLTYSNDKNSQSVRLKEVFFILYKKVSINFFRGILKKCINFWARW